MLKRTIHFLISEDGSTSIEYSLIAFIVVMAITIYLSSAGLKLKAIFETLANAF